MTNRPFYTLLLLLLAAGLSAQTICYVDGTSGNDTQNNGSSWAKAYKSIAKAISENTATDPTTGSVQIWIKAGTYPQTSTLTLKQWVHLYGGFQGTETTIEQRTKTEASKPWEFVNTTYIEPENPYTGKLIASGDLDKDNLTLVDGLTIRNAKDVGMAQGIGVRAQYCVFQNNQNRGITGWKAGNVGYSYFLNNKGATGKNGGGMDINFTTGNSGLVEFCTFEGNNTFSSENGHGLHLQNSSGQTGTTSSLVVRNCTFYNNGNGAGAGAAHGGAISVASPWFTIVNCLIYNNGGKSTVRLSAGNSLEGLFCNNTLANNNGDGIYLDNATTAGHSFLYNCIITGHPAASKSINYNGLTTNVIKNCAYASLYSGANATECIQLPSSTENTWTLFAQPTSFRGPTTDPKKIAELQSAAPNWRLSELSPLKDKGENSLLPTAYQDIDWAGNARIFGSNIEMGAFETTGVLSEKEQAILTLLDYSRKNSNQKWSISSDLSATEAKAQLANDGVFEDLRTEQKNNIDGIISSSTQSNQDKVSNFLSKVSRRLWVIAESYRNKELSTTDFPAIRNPYWKSIVHYLSLERRRPNNNTRFHSSCFLIPTAMINCYFALWQDMEKVENGVAEFQAYDQANRLIKLVGYQCWTQPLRGDFTDENPVRIERFQKDVWWVGGNALGYRSLVPASIMLRSIEMLDVASSVAQNALDMTSQNTFDNAFWTEGFTADGAGWGHGKQNIIWGYPSDGAGSAVDMLVLLKDSPWGKTLSTRNTQALMNYFRGASWYYHNTNTPPCLDRHNFSYSNIGAKEIPYKKIVINIKDHFLNSFTPNEQTEIIQLASELSQPDLRMDGYPSGAYTGTRWFYNNDDLIKKNSSYYWLVNMASSRCDGTESDPTQADFKNFFTADGLTLFQKQGSEYRRAFGASTLTGMPGVTARQCQSSLNGVTNWRGYNSLHNWAAGATRGENAVGGFIFEKHNAASPTSEPNPKLFGIYAHKGYFMQGDYLICLGAGITNKQTGYPENIHTTIDQTLRSGNISVIEKATSNTYTTAQTIAKQELDGLSGVSQAGGFIYKVLPEYSSSMTITGESRPTNWNSLHFENQRVSNKSTTENILHLYIDHGVKPSNATYGYFVYGGTDSAAKVIKKDPPFEVLCNTKELQAIRSTDNKTIQALFYTHTTPLTWNEGKGTLQVSAPCALQVEETSTSFFITLGEATMSKTLSQIEVLTSLPLGSGSEDAGNGLRKVVVPLPAGENACASITVEVSKSTSAIPTPEHSPSLISVTRQGEQTYITTECPSEVRINNMGGSTIFRKSISGTYGVVLPQGVYIISGSSDKGGQSIKVKQ